jgi:hypothetical protein
MARMKNGPGKNAIQSRALQTLKQKRMYETQLSGLQQQTFNMESAAMTTDNLRNTMATVDAMQTANKELRRQYGKVDIDKIEVGPLVYARCFIFQGLCRTFTMTWKIFSNKRMRYKR